MIDIPESNTTRRGSPGNYPAESWLPCVLILCVLLTREGGYISGRAEILRIVREFVYVYIIACYVPNVAYDISKLHVLVEIQEEQDAYLYPGKYVVAAFSRDVSEQLPIKDEADGYNIVSASVPAVRFINTDEIGMEIIYKTNSFSRFNRDRARVAREFYSLFNRLGECEKGCIPTEVAIMRKTRPAVAMYLFAFDQYDYLDIAMEFDVSIEAVIKYRQRVLDESFGGE